MPNHRFSPAMQWGLWTVAVTVIIVTVTGYWCPESVNLLTLAVLTLTLAVLVLYVYDTHRIADQAVEANLRPVILRSGFISNWNDIGFKIEGQDVLGRPIEFTVLKNIAKDISGYIVLDHRKYTFRFGNEISRQQVRVTAEPAPPGQMSLRLAEYWGWMKPDTLLLAVFLPADSEDSKEDNNIYLTYRDMSGNAYFTREDKNLSQVSGKL